MKRICELSLLVLIFCFAMSAAAEEKKALDPLKLILFTPPSPLVVGEAKGFFAEEGIKLDLTSTRNSVEQVRGILAGTWDLAQTATDNVIAYVESEGVDLVVLAGVERGLSEEVAAKRLAQEMNPATATVPKAAIDVKGIEVVVQLRAEAGLLKIPLPPAEKYYDMTYYNRAVQR